MNIFNHWIKIALVALLIGVIAWAYKSGYSNGKQRCEAKVEAARQQYQKQIKSIDAEHQRVLASIESQKETTNQEVIRYVKTTPSRQCFGDHGLRILRRAARRPGSNVKKLP